ncbi:MAG: hypothetical protein JW734_01435 [Candidatus Omnitrophica bacterium]|nr:hypothetical protein [Candidatus Omnitrophota bacterium]
MFKKNIILLVLAASIALLAGYFIIFSGFSLGSLQREKAALLEKVSSYEEKIEQLTASLVDKQAELDDLGDKVDELSYPQRLKRALSAAQDMINSLNSELTSIKAQSDVLRGENFALKNQMQANIKELDTFSSQLQEAKVKILNLESRQDIAFEQEQFNRLKMQIKEKDRQTQSLIRELGELKDRYAQSIKERDFLKKNIERYQKELAGEKPSQFLQRRIEELTRQLEEKDKEKLAFEDKLSSYNKNKDDLIVEIEGYKRDIEELQFRNKSFQDQIVKLNSDLDQKSKAVYDLEEKLKEYQIAGSTESIALQEKVRLQNERLRTVTSLYNRLRDQLKELSDVLYRKDLELDEKEKQITGIKDQISYLKEKSEKLEEAFKSSEENQRKILERLSQTTSLNTALQERLREVSNLLGEDVTLEAEPLTKEKIGQMDLGGSLQDDLSKEEDADELRSKVEVILQSIESGQASGQELE